MGIGMAAPARIDEINILQATYEAMRQAIEKLSVRPQLLLNDAVTIPQWKSPRFPLSREMKKRFHCRSQHCGKGYKGQAYGRV